MTRRDNFFVPIATPERHVTVESAHMRDVPIIFSASMVNSLLQNRKTMTRRLAWSKTMDQFDDESGILQRAPSPWQRVKPGDRLWCRETWSHDAEDLETCRRAFEDAIPGGGFGPYYFVGETAPETLKWRSPIHMPRWASRLTLIVTATKIERVRDIREIECIAEGAEIIQLRGNPVDDGPMVRLSPSHVYGTPRTWFRELWDELHGGGAWDANPEVVALTFTVHKTNIDALPKAEAA